MRIKGKHFINTNLIKNANVNEFFFQAFNVNENEFDLNICFIHCLNMCFGCLTPKNFVSEYE